MTRALIIDDEKPARLDLRAMLGAHPEIEVVGEASTVGTARELLARADYTLVFLDIQLLGGSGFDLVPHVRPGARVIFATAHNDHALRAFEVNALDYLLKPVKAERLARALERIARPPAPEAEVAGRPAPTHELGLDDIVHLNTGTTARFVRVADLGVIEAEENYSRVRLADGAGLLVRRTLKAWEDLLPPAHFMRVHRAAIVNLTRLAGYRRADLRAVTLQVHGVSAPVSVGRLYWPALKIRLPGTLVDSR